MEVCPDVNIPIHDLTGEQTGVAATAGYCSLSFFLSLFEGVLYLEFYPYGLCLPAAAYLSQFPPAALLSRNSKDNHCCKILPKQPSLLFGCSQTVLPYSHL